MTDVEAHITGTVWKIECEVGDEIEEGDTVAVLEQHEQHVECPRTDRCRAAPRVGGRMRPPLRGFC